jgi:hypothetical protein
VRLPSVGPRAQCALRTTAQVLVEGSVYVNRTILLIWELRNRAYQSYEALHETAESLLLGPTRAGW